MSDNNLCSDYNSDGLQGQLLLLSDIKQNLVIIKINKSYNPNLSTRELYEYTRGFWKNRLEYVQPAQYALAVAKGEVVEVYKINEWVMAKDADNIIRTYDPKRYHDRIAFVGEIAPDNVRDYYIGRRIGMLYKNGEANPVKLFLKSNEKEHSISDINTPVAPKEETIRLICARCQMTFIKAPRCPECGQLIKFSS